MQRSSEDQQSKDPKSEAPIAPPSNGSLQSGSILGSKISLITNALVRYEGILSEVDPIKKSMTLISVRSFGTEGRRNGVNEINMIDSEIPQVQFKVDQIKDFKIISKPDLTLLDPAILSTSSEVPSVKPKALAPVE
jgi:protein LSM14